MGYMVCGQGDEAVVGGGGGLVGGAGQRICHHGCTVSVMASNNRKLHS